MVVLDFSRVFRVIGNATVKAAAFFVGQIACPAKSPKGERRRRANLTHSSSVVGRDIISTLQDVERNGIPLFVGSNCQFDPPYFANWQFALQSALALEGRFVGVDGLVKFARGKVAGEYRLRDNVGRFGVADHAERIKPAVREGGLEFAVERVVGNALGDEDQRVSGESRLSGGDGMFNGNRPGSE